MTPWGNQPLYALHVDLSYDAWPIPPLTPRQKHMLCHICRHIYTLTFTHQLTCRRYSHASSSSLHNLTVIAICMSLSGAASMHNLYARCFFCFNSVITNVLEFCHLANDSIDSIDQMACSCLSIRLHYLFMNTQRFVSYQ